MAAKNIEAARDIFERISFVGSNHPAVLLEIGKQNCLQASSFRFLPHESCRRFASSSIVYHGLRKN